MADDDFDGTFNTVAWLTVVTPGGGTVTVEIQGIENLTPPGRQHKKDTWTPISGDRTGYEQQALCSQQSATIEATLTYELSRQMEIDDVVGINGCTISLKLSDGLLISGTGGIEKMSFARMEDSKHNTSDFTIALNAGWEMTDGGAVAGEVVVPLYTVTMDAGAATIDLTACGVGGDVNLGGGGGYKVTEIYLKAPTGNDNDVTVEEGASNGFTLPDTAVVEPGNEHTISIATANRVKVDGTHKTLDVSGTLAQAIQIRIRAIPA